MDHPPVTKIGTPLPEYPPLLDPAFPPGWQDDWARRGAEDLSLAAWQAGPSSHPGSLSQYYSLHGFLVKSAFEKDQEARLR